MAQTGYSKVQIYSSSTASNTPSAGNLTNDTSGSELAINITDGKLFYKDNAGAVQVLATKGSAVVGGSNTQVQYNSSGTLAGSANLTFDGTTLTANALTTTSTVTINGGTANGVAYLNGSKVLTTGSALVFDGTNLGVGVTPSAWGSSWGKAIQVGSNYVAFANHSSNTIIGNNWYNNGTNDIYANNGYAVLYQQTGGVHSWYNAASGTAGNAITFTQAMTLDTSGNLTLNASSPNIGLEVKSTGYAASLKLTSTSGVDSANRNWRISANSAVAGNLDIFRSTSDGGTASTQVASFDSSGNLLIGYTNSNGSYKLQVNSQIFATSSTIATSDARYKENVEELSGALDIVKALRPVSFDWKAHPIHNFDTTTKTVGFLAQDVQQTLAGKPYLNSIIKTNECVIESEVKDENGNVTKEAVTEEFLGIAEGNMISILTAAIQELSAQVTALQTQVTALKG